MDYENNIMSAKETAQYLHISYWLLLELVKKHVIPYTRFGNRLIFRKDSLDNYMKNCELSSISN